ncbi:hypothetical protein SALBM135S_01783 [Streptomyces alboniger]
MRGPRVRVAGGDHQDVTGRAPGVQEQVDRLFGRVQRTGGRGRDELDLRDRRGGAVGGRRRGSRSRTARCGGGRGYGRDRGPWLWRPRRAARAAPACRPGGTRTAGARRRRGTRTGYGAGGRRGAATGRRGAGTLGTLVNLRLLGKERLCCLSNADATRVGGWHRSAAGSAGKASELKAELTLDFRNISFRPAAGLLEVPPLGQRIKIRPRKPVVRGGAPLRQRGLVHRRRNTRHWPRSRKSSWSMPSSAIILSRRTLAITEAAATATQDWSPLITVQDPPRSSEVVVLAVEDDRVRTDRQPLESAHRGEPKRRRHPHLVDLLVRGVTEGVRRDPALQLLGERGAPLGADQLGVGEALGRPLRSPVTAAQTVTGPAHAPRPTSSTPATIFAPVVARRERSTVWVGASYGMAPDSVRRPGQPRDTPAPPQARRRAPREPVPQRLSGAAAAPSPGR